MSGTERSVVWAADRPVPIGVAEPAPEEWRLIPGWPGYEVSDTGRVISHKRGRAREITGTDSRGYRRVHIRTEGCDRRVGVHRLVAAAFLGPCPDGMEVRHLDGDPGNNRLLNLAYGTRSENMRDRTAHGGDVNANKTHCVRGHEYTALNTRTYQGKRSCKTCQRQHKRDYKIRKAFAAANISLSERAA